MGLASDVRFTGNQDDVPAWYACADIAVLPSYGDEGVPQSLMQAAACGLPAISTTIGAIAEAVRDGKTGLLVPPRDVKALASALSYLMTHDELRGHMGKAARGYAQNHFGIDRMLDAMEAVFAQRREGAPSDVRHRRLLRPPARPRRARAGCATPLRRRGPDAQHDAVFDLDGKRLADDAVAPIALVHTRLSIIDPRPVADQPMRNDDGTIWIAYNGEVYGWQADARELEARDVRFSTWCDTEFILRGYEAWGIEALLPRLRGMFAFAIVDFRTKRVHVVRDRMG